MYCVVLCINPSHDTRPQMTLIVPMFRYAKRGSEPHGIESCKFANTLIGTVYLYDIYILYFVRGMSGAVVS